MKSHELYLQRCLELAQLGMGHTAPNPLVGSVIVHQGRIIGEGWHQVYGEPHAEVNAIRSVKDPDLLAASTIYVNLEPCAHHGKTPPCADLIVAKNIPRVVIGCRDPFAKVNGQGIARLKAAGVEVIEGVLEQESLDLNRRFITFHQHQRPYIILKWAQTADGYLDHIRTPEQPALAITSAQANRLVHQWRREETAILVGSETVLKDNPRLTTRLVPGRSPIRIVLDGRGRVQAPAHIVDGTVETLIFGQHKAGDLPKVTAIPHTRQDLTAVLQELHQRKIQSVIVEGGRQVLQSFLDQGLWDEARVWVGPQRIQQGVAAPPLPQQPAQKQQIGPDRLKVFRKA